MAFSDLSSRLASPHGATAGRRRKSEAAWNFAELRGGRRNRLLASTAVAGGILAALSANPQSAFAACSAAGTGSGTVTINCGTTATTDASTFNADTPGADTRTWRYLTDQINATISGNITNYGLEFSNSFVGANAAINVVHNGTINQTLAPTVPANSNSLAALSIFASRAITYTGAGTITTNVPGADGLLAFGAGTAGDISLTTGQIVATGFAINAVQADAATTGNLQVNVNGAVTSSITDSVRAHTNSSNAASTVTVNVANNITAGTAGDTSDDGVDARGINGLVTVNQTAGTVVSGGGGLVALTSGTGSVNVNMSGGQIGTSASRAGFGIITQTDGAGANQLVNAAGPIFSTFTGVSARADGSGTITVNTSGEINSLMGDGVSAVNFIGTSPTNIITVNSAGNITAGNDVNDAGVRAQGVNGLVTLNQTAGTILASGVGIAASSSGTGGVTVNMTGGQVGTAASRTGFYGVYAATSGADATAGNVLANVGTVFSASQGVFAQVFNTNSTGTVTVNANGPIDALFNGVNATTSSTNAASTVTVNVNNNVTAGANGVAVQGINGLLTVNQTAGTILAPAGWGIFASSTGNGGIAVNMTGGQIGTAANRAGSGIVVATQGTAGDVNITSRGIFSTNEAINAFIVGTSSGNINIIQNGALNASAGNGIVAGFDNTFSGSTAVTQNAAITAGAIGIWLFDGAANTVTSNAPVTGATGVRTSGGTTTVTNRDRITGTGGTAVRFSGANNLFIMDGPGAALTGLAIGSGTDTFRFGGTGSNTFDTSQISTGWSLLDKAGSSTWTLTGTSTYAGPATVSAGTLLVNGNLSSASGIAVASGATLGGTGTLPTTTINSGGALSPGNSIGTITISGNLSFVGAGNYIVEVSGANSDKTVVTGTATLDGAVQVVPLSRVTTKTTYTIMSAATLSGSFDSASVQAGNFFARNPMLSYVGGDVLLTLDPGLLSPLLAAGATPNQRSVAGGIDSAITAGNPMSGFDALFSLSPAVLSGALDQLSGEVHVSTAGVLADESRYMRDAVLGRLRQASYGGNASMASLSVGGPVAAFADGELDSALAYGKSPIVTKAPRMVAPSHDVTFWAQGFGARGRFETDGNAATLRRDLAGFISGVDTRIGSNGRLGVAAGYTGSKNALDGRGIADVETAHIAGYGGWNFGAFNLRAGGAYAFHSINTDRLIAFPGFFDRTTANYDGHTGQVFGELGYGFALGNVAIEPFAGAAWVRVKTDAAAERGGLAALNVAGMTFETGYATLGIRAASMIPLGHDMVLIPRGTLAWQHAFDNVTPAGALAFQAAPVPFTIAGVPIARDSLLAEAGLDLAIGRQATLGISYVGQHANNVQDHAAKGKFSWKF